MREKRRLGGLTYTPQLRMEPTTWVCALTSNQTPSLLVYRTMLQLSHPVRANAASNLNRNYFITKQNI